MALIGGPAQLLLALFLVQPAQQQINGDHAADVKRLASTALLAAQEYRIGVRDGRVVLPPEVEEAKLFLTEARRSAGLLPHDDARAATAQIDTLLQLVGATAEPDSVDVRVRRLAAGLAQRFNVSLDDIPAATPSLARGAEVYQANCASCHGAAGRGDGPAAAGLEPVPANLADADALRDASPLDFYRRITIGVAGTAMPSFETRLSADDRWAAAVYSSLLRLPAPRGEVPAALRAFPATARMSDAELLAALGGDDREHRAQLAQVRGFEADATADAAAAVFDRVRAQLDSAYSLARRGDSAAASASAFDAYMTFEQVERNVRAKNPGLATELEAAFASLRTRVSGGATAAELDAIRRQLASGLERAERVVGDELSPVGLFVQSFILLLREGLEAILIVGALLTFLSKTGAGNRRRDIHIGVGAALAASLVTAFVLETIFQISPARQELLEGLVMASATFVLFYVSYWLLSKMEVVKWTHFVKSKVSDAVTSGSALALASAAFLAVYREGFETVLFYKALFLSGGAGSTALPVLAGMAVGGVVLVAVYVAINRFGVRLPLRPFFAVTSAFLYYMAFVFAGKSVAELQEGGLIGTTIIQGAPRVPALGIYPTLESLAAQGVLVALALGAMFWIFLVEPRRLRVTQVMVPDAPPAAASAAAPAAAPVASTAPAPPAAGPSALPAELSRELVRSLERMDADLAEMRAEVERMRRHLAQAHSREESTRRR